MENQTDILTTKDVSKQLKMTPRALRVYLRRINGKAPGVKYEFRATDIKKLSEQIAAEKAKDDAAKKAVSPVEEKPAVTPKQEAPAVTSAKPAKKTKKQ